MPIPARVSQPTAASVASVLPPAPPVRKSARLGEIVVELGHATRARVDAAVESAREAGRPIGEHLVDTRVITGDQLAEALAYRFGVDHVHLSNFAVDMEEPPAPDAADLAQSAGDAPVAKLMRVDGVMTDGTSVPARMAPAVISRLKIMASLDIAERRRPQDGRIGMSVERRHVDLRVVACRWSAASRSSCACSTRAACR